MKKNEILFFIIVVFISTSFFAQEKAKKIEKLIQKYVEYGLFSGSVLAAKKGQVIIEEGYGLANREFSVLNAADTKFRIGSISKQFTAAIILQLVEEGKIDLNGKITDYLKDYRKVTGEAVTIHQLLNHTSGIKSYTNIFNVRSDSLKIKYDKKYFIKHFHSNDLEFEPGTKFNYNNTGYYLLAAIAEEVTGEQFGKLLKNRILDKVGMSNSGSEDTEEVISKAAYGYMKRGNIIIKDAYIYMPNVMGAGHMFSTVGDLYKWDRSLYTDEILSDEMKEKMFTPGLSNYGYGWLIEKVPRTVGGYIEIMTHSGGLKAFRTLLIRAPEEDIFIAVLSNNQSRSNMDIAMNIGRILLDEVYYLHRKPIADSLSVLIEEEGIAYTIAVYKQLKEKKRDAFNFSEDQLNNLGHDLLNQDRYDEAIEIFKLNLEEYPKSANVYASLGETYLEKGNKDKAIEFYKKALQINPADQDRKEKLRELGVKITNEEISVSSDILKSYVGEYKLAEGMIFRVREDKGHLYVMLTGQPELEVFPLTDKKFYFNVVDAQIEFNMDESNEIVSLTLYQNGRVILSPKIK